MSVTLSILLDPKLDATAFNSIIEKLKSVGIKVDPNTAASFKKIADDAAAASTSVDGMAAATGRVGAAASIAQKAFNFNQIQQGIQSATSALSGLSAPFVDYEKSLSEVKAITGVTDETLADLGKRGKLLALEFGGSVVGQMDAFKGVLSRFGPDIAKSPVALDSMARSINTLSKAGGIDAAASMDTLTNAALQFGVDLSDPVKAADKLKEMMNVLASSAQVGAAEIPQVGAAVVVAGSAMKSANVSFEEGNAAIQVLAAKSGKYGSEAGNGLRNVIGLLQKNSGEAEKLTKKLGIPFDELGKTLTTQGLGAAMSQLQGGLSKLGTDAERNAAVMQLFGAENSSVAVALLNNTDTLADFRTQMTGTNSATEQAAINMDNTAGALDRLKAKVAVGLTTAFESLGSNVTLAVNSVTQLAPTLTGLASIKAVIPPDLATNALSFGRSMLSSVVPSLVTTQGATAAAGGGFRLMWAAATGPIGLVIAGVAALAVGVHFLSDALHQTAEEKLADNATEQELLKTQREGTQAKYDQAIASQSLAKQYEQLATTTNRTAEQNSKFIDISSRLATSFPGVIDGTKSTGEQMKTLHEQVAASTDKIINLGAELYNLDAKLANAQKLQISLEVDVAKENIENDLTDAMNVGFLDGLKAIGKGDFKTAMRGLNGAGLQDTISEALFGTSMARKGAETLSKTFTDKIYGAKTADEVAAATAEFQAKIALDGEKLGISKQEQLKVLNSISAFGKKKIDSIKTINENEKNLTVTQADSIAKVLKDSTKAGASSADAIKKIAEAFGISETAAKKAGLEGTLREATKAGAPTKEKIAEIAKQFGVTAEEAAKVVAEQVKQETQAKATATAVVDIAKSFTDLKKSASDALGKAQDTAAGLRVALADLRSGTLSVEQANKQYGLTATTVDEARIQLTKKLKDERTSAAKQDRENIRLGRIADSENKDKQRSEQEKNITTAANAKKREIDTQLKLAEQYAKSTISNQNDLQRKLLTLQSDAEVKKLDEDIAAANEAAKVKYVTASTAERRSIADAIKTQIKAREDKQAELTQKLLELDGKIAVERRQAAVKAEEQRFSAEFDTAQRLLDKLTTSDLAHDESALQRAEKLATAKAKIAELTADKEINEVIAKNDKVLIAEKNYEAALLSQNKAAINRASVELAEAKASAYSNPLVLAAAEKEIKALEQIEREKAIRLEQIRIKAIENTADREAQTGLQAAKEAFDKQFKDAEKNRDLELTAIADFGKKKFELLKEQALKEYEGVQFVFDFKAKLIEELGKKEDDAANQALAKIKQDNSTKREELLKNLQAGKESYSGYTKGILAIADEQRKAEEQANASRFSFLDKLQKAASASFEEAAKRYEANSAKLQEKYIGLLSTTGAKEEEIAAARTALFTSVANAGLAQLAQFAIAGTLTAEKAIKIMLKTALSALEAMIPIWSAQILGYSISQPASVASFGATGFANWLLLTGFITGAVEAAKVAIGNKDGVALVKPNNGYGTVDGKPATRTSDNIARLLSLDEGVINARANTAKGKYYANYELVDLANKSGKPIEELVLARYARQMGSYDKVAKVTEFTPRNSDVIYGMRDDSVRHSMYVVQAIERQTAVLEPTLKSIAQNTGNTALRVKEQTKAVQETTKAIKQQPKQHTEHTLGGNY